MKPYPPLFLVALCTILLCLAPGRLAQAADSRPPRQLTYQGFLTDANGVPLGNTAPLNKTIIFRIYDAPTAGELKWSSQQVVTLDKGHFSVLLGEGSQVGQEPFNADLTSIFVESSDASDRYLQMTVDNVNIAPRLRFLPAPYAMNARTASRMADAATGALALRIVGDNIVAEGNITANGNLTAVNLSGNGAGLTSLNASQVTTGTLNAARVPNLDAGKVTSGILHEDRIPRILPGTLTVGTLIATNFQSSALALINVVYPLGVFYVQYPNADSNTEATAFPASQSPASLFPGTEWVEKFTDGVFFRTEGGNAAESRVNGIQNYALKQLTGYTPWFQTDYGFRTNGGTGVFTNLVETRGGSTDSGGGGDTTKRAFFDSSVQALPSSTEVRPKNRLMKVWQRTN